MRDLNALLTHTRLQEPVRAVLRLARAHNAPAAQGQAIEANRLKAEAAIRR